MSLSEDVNDKYNEAEYFLELMRHHEAQYRAAARWGAQSQANDVMAHLHRFRYCLSAFLEATYALRNYILQSSALSSDDAMAWKDEARQLISFGAFGALRTTGVHKNTISLGRRHKVVLKASLGGIVADREGELSGPDFVFAESILRRYPAFKDKDPEVTWLSDHLQEPTVVGRSSQYLADMADFIKRGRDLRILKAESAAGESEQNPTG